MVALTHNIAKKQHRERAQPLERRKWGLLEKKKDYKLRSQDFHKKEAHLKLLRKKATDRNPDEFYHAMVNKKTDKKGVLITERGNEVLSNEAAKLLKTQDSGYVRTMTVGEAHKIEKLESQLLFDSAGQHTVFVDNDNEAKSFDPSKFFDTDKSLLYRRENRLRRSQLEDENLISLIQPKEEEEDEDSTKQQPDNGSEKSRLSKYKELDRRLERQQQLMIVQKEMDLQRELMKKGDKKKIIDKDGRQTWKWKNVRRR